MVAEDGRIRKDGWVDGGGRLCLNPSLPARGVFMTFSKQPTFETVPLRRVDEVVTWSWHGLGSGHKGNIFSTQGISNPDSELRAIRKLMPRYPSRSF